MLINIFNLINDCPLHTNLELLSRRTSVFRLERSLPLILDGISLFLVCLSAIVKLFVLRRTHTIANARKGGKELRDTIQPLPALGNLSPSLGLGAVGMPGYVIPITTSSSPMLTILSVETLPTLDSFRFVNRKRAMSSS